jgi:two-component SAPR family response regulator
MSNSEEGLVYYRVPHDQSKLTEWLADLAKELDITLGGFGKNLHQALDSKASPTDLGEALAADLGAYKKTKTVVLYIDELDRATLNGAFREFCSALVAALPKKAQLAFSSRLLTYQPWYDMVARNEAIVLGTEHRKNDVMFTVEDKPKPQLEVYALGRGHALVNGQAITNWDGALPRNLFFFFMDRPLVTRDEIFATFWPDLSIKEATNVFHVTKRKISERISMKVEDSGNYELTQYSSGFYLPSEKVVRHYDVADFQEAVERALVAATEREEEMLYRRAVDLYKAPFLQTVNMRWVLDRRDHLRQLYAQSLVGLGRIYRQREEYNRALGYFSRALREAPEREDLHREAMRAYWKLGMTDDARNQYQRLRQMLHDTLKIEPSRETRELYEMIEGSR